MDYPVDPGGRFKSDYHRRVLGHLPIYTDDYGWTLPALFNRMFPDVGTSFSNPEELQAVLDDLEADGYAESIPVTVSDDQTIEIWRQTESGSNTMSLGLPNEPPPGAAVVGPANVGIGAVSINTPTQVPGSGLEAVDLEQPEGVS